MIGQSGERLIYLISLPRSGSTLLQHLLAAHPKIGATAEPWAMFPGICALKPGALVSDYDAGTARVALGEFLGRLPGGESLYYRSLGEMARSLYNAALEQVGGEWFVDKSTRYYQVLPELAAAFPSARFLLLARNPLAVLASYFDHMVFGDWRILAERAPRRDLLDGFRSIAEGAALLGDRAFRVRYEELASSPETVMRDLCAWLGLEFEPGMLRYGERVGVLPGKLRDQKSIHLHDRPVGAYAEAWRERLRTKQELSIARGFLRHLGPELVGGLGYDYGDLEAAVAGPGEGRGPVVGWEDLMAPPEKRGIARAIRIRLAYRFQRPRPPGQ